MSRRLQNERPTPTIARAVPMKMNAGAAVRLRPPLVRGKAHLPPVDKPSVQAMPMKTRLAQRFSTVLASWSSTPCLSGRWFLTYIPLNVSTHGPAPPSAVPANPKSNANENRNGLPEFQTRLCPRCDGKQVQTRDPHGYVGRVNTATTKPCQD
jgi:hypothetical protein